MNKTKGRKIKNKIRRNQTMKKIKRKKKWEETIKQSIKDKPGGKPTTCPHDQENQIHKRIFNSELGSRCSRSLDQWLSPVSVPTAVFLRRILLILVLCTVSVAHVY
jgi:hypothetical protein